MLYNCDLAMQICRELGIKWNPDASEATVCGNSLPVDFSVANLFESALDRAERISTKITLTPTETEELSEPLKGSNEYYFSDMACFAA